MRKSPNTGYAEIIKERVSMRDVIDRYVPNPPPKQNRIPCPIHNGQGYNLHFVERGYQCWACGEKGDTINFVQHILGLSFPAALERLNADFSLGLPLDRLPTLREQAELQRRARAVADERARIERERVEKENAYNILLDEYARLDCDRMDFAPTDPEEPIDLRYAEAVKRIDGAAYDLECFLAKQLVCSRYTRPI